MSEINIMLINSSSFPKLKKIQFMDLTNFREELNYLLSDADTEYFIFYHNDITFDHSFYSNFTNCFKGSHKKPDIVIWNRVHRYEHDGQEFSSSWSIFHETNLLQRNEFFQCLPVLIREYEALVFRGCCNRAYSRSYLITNMDDIFYDVDDSIIGEGFRSLANITQIMFMDTSVKSFKYCSGISLYKYWNLIETFYLDLQYIYKYCSKDLALEYGYDEITSIGVQYAVLQLNNISYFPKYDETGNTHLNMNLFLHGLDKWMNSDIFKDIIIFQPNSHNIIFREFRKIIITILTARVADSMNNEQYLKLLLQLCKDFPFQSSYILLVQFYTQKRMMDNLKDQVLFADICNDCDWKLWYLTVHALISPNIRELKSKSELQVIKHIYCNINAYIADDIVRSAWDTIWAIFDLKNEVANQIIHYVEEKGLNCEWFYKICYQLCIEFGIPEIADDFYNEFGEKRCS